MPLSYYVHNSTVLLEPKGFQILKFVGNVQPTMNHPRSVCIDQVPPVSFQKTYSHAPLLITSGGSSNNNATKLLHTEPNPAVEPR